VVIAGGGGRARLYHFAQLFYLPGKLFELALPALLLGRTDIDAENLRGDASPASLKAACYHIIGYLLQLALYLRQLATRATLTRFGGGPATLICTGWVMCMTELLRLANDGLARGPIGLAGTTTRHIPHPHR